RSGGWGYLIGDEGSGYAIARAAVAAAMRAADGRGQPTAILELLLKKFGVASPPELVERIYAPEFKREQLATLCTLVFDAARHDAVARPIIENAAADLAELVAAVCKRLGFCPRPYPLALAGTVILKQPLLRSYLSEKLDALRSRPALISLVEDPVRGAVALARQLVTE